MEEFYIWFKGTLFYKDPIFKDLILAIIPSILDIIIGFICFAFGRITKKTQDQNSAEIEKVIDKYNSLLLEKDRALEKLKKENKRLKNKQRR